MLPRIHSDAISPTAELYGIGLEKQPNSYHLASIKEDVVENIRM